LLALKNGSERSAPQVARAAAGHAPPGYLYSEKCSENRSFFAVQRRLYCIGTRYLPATPCFVQE